jgi:hypothetical protein
MRCSEGEPIPKNLLEINKFSVSISDEVLEDLRKRLELAHFVCRTNRRNCKFNNGFNGNYLRKVLEYWITKYDWRKHEKEFNQFDQYIT